MHDFLSCSLGKNDGEFFFSIREPGNFDSILITFFRNTTSLRLTDNQWHHVCCTFNAGNTEAFLNGVSVGTTTNSSATTNPNGASDFEIGRANNYNFYFNSGKISNVALFNSSLTEQQVQTLYNNGSPELSISYSPVAWWKLDNTDTGIEDSVGSNDGTNNGATEIQTNVWTPRLNGESDTLPSTALVSSDLQFNSAYSSFSLDFDGAGDYISASASNLPTSDYTFSAWVKISSFGGDYGILGYGDYSSVRGSNAFRFESSPIQLKNYWYGDDFNHSLTTSQQNEILNNWAHVAVTYDSSIGTYGQRVMYLNGNQIATNNPTGAAAFNLQNFTIGRTRHPSSPEDFNGNIDETAIWNRALNQAEITSIYNNGYPKDITALSPISWWRLGEDAYFNGNDFIIPNQITGAPNGTSNGMPATALVADAPGSYAAGLGSSLALADRVGDAPLSTANSLSFNMIPSNRISYPAGYTPAQVDNVYSMDFDSANSTHINIGNISAINGLQKVTYSFWMNDSSGGASYPIGTDGQLILMPLINSNRFDVYLNGTSGSARIYNNQTLTILNTNQWHHIVLVIDSTLSTANQRTKIYIDGTYYIDLSGTAITQNATIGTVSTDTNIGRASGSAPGYFSGKLDEVAIFDYALSARQIKQDIYNATTSGKTADLNNNSNLTAPIAWYRMGD